MCAVNKKNKKHQLIHSLHKKSGGKCFYCYGVTTIICSVDPSWFPRRATLDHVKPRVFGGTNDPKNLVLCCGRCNNTKADGPVSRLLAPTFSNPMVYIPPKREHDYYNFVTAERN